MSFFIFVSVSAYPHRPPPKAVGTIVFLIRLLKKRNGSECQVFLIVVLLILGLILIVKGGDLFVDAASWMAEVSGIPKLIVGATVVSIATTMPELLVSSFAAADGKVDMCVGNAVGSVTANIGLIMALALICMPARIRRREYLLKSILMLSAAALTAFCAGLGGIGLGAGLILFAIYALSMAENIRGALVSMREPGAREERRVITGGIREISRNLIKFLLGAAGIIVGADLLVDNGSALALLLGVPERVIAVTLVAVGTSLPELVTTLTAIAKHEHSLSAGNIIGANIIDLTLILPIAAVISGGTLPITAQMAAVDLPVCLLVGGIALIPALIFGQFFVWQGVTLLAVYGGYVVFTCIL